MRISNTKNREVHCNDVDEWIDYATNTFPSDYMTGASRDGFAGAHNGVELGKRISARQCDENTRKKVHKHSVTLPPVATELDDGLTFFSDQQGLFLDSQAYYNGDEDCMINFNIQESIKPIVWIAANIGGLGDVSAKQFVNRGVALIRAVHAMERAGVSIGLIGYNKSSMSGKQVKSVLQTVVIKHPDNALDESTLINVFADKAAFRTIGFGAISGMMKSPDSMGATESPIPSDFKLSYANEHELVILPYTEMYVNDCPETATEWTLEHIKAKANISL